eukprot:jgi/Chlat1/5941/Chrsp4S06416
MEEPLPDKVDHRQNAVDTGGGAAPLIGEVQFGGMVLIERTRSGAATMAALRQPLIDREAVKDEYFVHPEECDPDLSPRAVVVRIGRSDLSTVFCLTNSMVGGGILVLPWAFGEAGMLLGTIITLLVGAICCYTCILMVTHGGDHDSFAEVAAQHLGGWARTLSIVTTVLILVAGAISYDILIVDSVYAIVQGALMAAGSDPAASKYGGGGVLELLRQHWSPYCAVGIVALLLLPLTMLKNLKPLANLSSYGVVFIGYTLFFMFFQSLWVGPIATVPYIKPYYSKSFAHLAGVCASSFFVHHACLPICQSATKRHHNRRNLAAAYILSCVCYISVGVVGNYAEQWVAKREAPGGEVTAMNFLAVFGYTDALASSARLAVTCQLVTVYPLLLYILRTQLFSLSHGTGIHPGSLPVFLLNTTIVAGASLCAAFQVGLGSVLRYAGALCGLILIYLLPVAVHLQAQRAAGKASVVSIAGHVGLLGAGVALLASQFWPS